MKSSQHSKSWPKILYGNPLHSLENDMLQVMLMSHTPPGEVAILVFSIAISLCDLQVENQGQPLRMSLPSQFYLCTSRWSGQNCLEISKSKIQHPKRRRLQSEERIHDTSTAKIPTSKTLPKKLDFGYGKFWILDGWIP